MRIWNSFCRGGRSLAVHVTDSSYSRQKFPVIRQTRAMGRFLRRLLMATNWNFAVLCCNRFLPSSPIQLSQRFLFVLNTVDAFWKMFVYESLLGIWESFLCSVLALQLKIILLLDVQQQLLLCAESSFNVYYI